MFFFIKTTTPNERKQELEKCGVYYDDGYDYMQHLKSLEEFRHIVPDARQLEYALNPSDEQHRSRVESESSTTSFRPSIAVSIIINLIIF